MEAEHIMNRKMSALNITGSNSRVVSKEIFNSFYELTKIEEKSKKVSESDTKEYLETSPDGFTRSKIAKMFADSAIINKDNKVSKKKSKYDTWDTMIIPVNYFYEGHGEITTTIGRFLFNKYVLEGAGVIVKTKVIIEVLNKAGLGVLDNLIGKLYLDDDITRQQFNNYVNRRDNLGYWINGMLAHTISLRMAKPLKEIEAKKKELYTKHAKEIENHNIDIMNMIENELVQYAKDILKDDPGMDLYKSGDLDFGNNYKNNSILKGPVKNKITNEFDFIGSSLMNGIEIKDIPIHANSILAGQYPASIATKDSGYMGKKLLALLQMMEIDEHGTDCGTKGLIPVTVTNTNKNDLLYTYFSIGGQIQLLTSDNINNYIDQVIMIRSPMVCITPKICNICAGELFYKLDAQKSGIFSTQLAFSALNLSLKSKHSSLISLYHLNPDTIIQDV